MTLYCILYYVIGFLCSMYVWYKEFEEINLATLFLSLLTAFLCPIMFIIFMIEFGVNIIIFTKKE